MLPSETFVKRPIVIDTETPGCEITIIDAQGKVVGNDVRRLSQELVPAIYKIRYRVGDQVIDQLIELPEGSDPFYAHIPQLPIISAASFLIENDTQSESAQFIDRIIRQPHDDVAKLASLFIFVRCDLELATAPERPGWGMSIHTFSGEQVNDFAEAKTLNGCIACTIPLEPGRYLLRVQMLSGLPVEQTIVLVEGWQTQFYVQAVPIRQETSSSTPPTTSASTPFVLQLDLARAGVLMVKQPALGSPDSLSTRWTAAARQALAAGRSKAAPNREMMSALLSGKFENPMLGIYAGHLLALQEKPDLDLLKQVADNLTSLIGDHPDVTSLLIPLADPRAKDLSYAEPPMLRSSWSLILNASTPEHDLRPSGSYAAVIGSSLWGTGVWLEWRMPAAVEMKAPSEDLFRLLFSNALSGKLTAAINTLKSSTEERSKLTPTESILLRIFDQATTQQQLAQQLTVEDDRRSSLSLLYPLVRSLFRSDLERDTDAKIAQAFTPTAITRLTGLPYSLLINATWSLAIKLGLKPKTSLAAQVLGALKFK